MKTFNQFLDSCMEQTNPPTKNKNNPLPFFNRSLKSLKPPAPGAGGFPGPIKPIGPIDSGKTSRLFAQRLQDRPDSRLNRFIPGV